MALYGRCLVFQQFEGYFLRRHTLRQHHLLKLVGQARVVQELRGKVDRNRYPVSLVAPAQMRIQGILEHPQEQRAVQAVPAHLGQE
ncbi:hypothetical protein D3C87_1555360 [compost metagenome]